MLLQRLLIIFNNMKIKIKYLLWNNENHILVVAFGIWIILNGSQKYCNINTYFVT